jgi:hypothetical protein
MMKEHNERLSEGKTTTTATDDSFPSNSVAAANNKPLSCSFPKIKHSSFVIINKMFKIDNSGGDCGCGPKSRQQQQQQE